MACKQNDFEIKLKVFKSFFFLSNFHGDLDVYDDFHVHTAYVQVLYFSAFINIDLYSFLGTNPLDIDIGTFLTSLQLEFLHEIFAKEQVSILFCCCYGY